MKIIHVVTALATVALFAQDGDDDERPTAPKVGEEVPAFRLNDDKGQAVAIGGESETWTVVAFFPKAMTPG